MERVHRQTMQNSMKRISTVRQEITGHWASITSGVVVGRSRIAMLRRLAGFLDTVSWPSSWVLLLFLYRSVLPKPVSETEWKEPRQLWKKQRVRKPEGIVMVADRRTTHSKHRHSFSFTLDRFYCNSNIANELLSGGDSWHWDQKRMHLLFFAKSKL